MRKYGITISVLILLFGLLILGQGITAQATGGESISIKDATGRSVEVGLPVKRMVVLTSDALEMVRALGAKDRVVGISDGIPKEPLFWPELKDRPVVGRWSEVNHELIAELKPDLVICYGRWPGPDLEKKLEPFGIKVVRLDFYKIPFLEKDVETLGRILQKEKRARQFIDWYREKLKLIEKRPKQFGKLPDIYVESYTEYHSVGPGSGAHDMCVLAGGHNIASDSSIPYPKVTPEWVLAKNPHIVVKATALGNCYAMTDPGPLKSVRDKIMARPAWDNIRAIQERKVYVMASDIWTGPRAIIGISYMAKWFHPEAFKYLDPEKLHREYLERFQGLKYQGVYVYP
ncbi:MAG: ABC transporter substrate-binding protein [Deltaproteobacteria bacterium]|nr:ABC transporter substrate-binding protein [Deltaproteobacteria bacterium]